MTLDSFIDKYSHSIESVTNKDLEFLQEHREELTFILLKELDRLITVAELSGDIYGSHLGKYALFLLAEYGEKKAWRKIISILHLYGEEIDAWLGDAYTENMASILYAVYDGDVASLRNAIYDDNIDQYVRSALISVYMRLWTDGAVSDEDGTAAVVKMIDDLEGEYLKAEVMYSLADEHRFEMLPLCREKFYKYLRFPREPIGDFAELLDNYYYYDKGDIRTPFDIRSELGMWYPVGDSVKPLYEESLDKLNSSGKGSVQALIDRLSGKEVEPDRNDPCPCGSGKKYKKCCMLARDAARQKGIPYESTAQIKLITFMYPELSFDPLSENDRTDFERVDGRIYLEDSLSRELILFDYYSVLAAHHDRLEGLHHEDLTHYYILKAFEHFVKALPETEFSSVPEFDEKYILHYRISETMGILIRSARSPQSAEAINILNMVLSGDTEGVLSDGDMLDAT